MAYEILHITRFGYHTTVSESVMEARLHPRSEGAQHCLSFDLTIEPAARRFMHRDHLGNIIHSFDIPVSHTELTLTARAHVTTVPLPPLPAALGPDAWRELDARVAEEDFWEALSPSHFARPTPQLLDLARLWDIRRRDDPLSLLREVAARIYETFKYVPQSTRVDSTIDQTLASGQGVCQDFTHIMIALVRQVRIPCRYVSGYLFHRMIGEGRSADDAMHAWAEAYLPGLGWVGIDPTNNTPASEHHIRVAVGRDYANVPPTRGVFKGEPESELCVAVQVYPAGMAPPAPHPVCVQGGAQPKAAAPAPSQQQQQQQQ